jgi:hypothetical protein
VSGTRTAGVRLPDTGQLRHAKWLIPGGEIWHCSCYGNAIMKAQQQTCYLARPLPEVHSAIVELHLCCREVLTPTTAPRPIVARIERGTMSAALAISTASLGTRENTHLRRARDTLVTCLDLVGFLFMHRHIDEALCFELRRRTNRVLIGIDALARVPSADWPTLKLASCADHDSSNRDAVAKMKKLIIEVAIASRRFAKPTDSSQPAVTSSKTIVAKTRRRKQPLRRRRAVSIPAPSMSNGGPDVSTEEIPVGLEGA